MENYSSNSYKSKEEKKDSEKKLVKVVKGSVRTKKKSDIQKIADIFIAEDISSVKNYILMDVLVPAIKKAIDDIVSDGVHMLLYNGDRKNGTRSTASKISYRQYSDRDNREYKLAGSRSGFDYDDIVFNSRGDAEAVLSAMQDVIDQFGKVSVADLYDLAEVSNTNYAANKYGWADIRHAEPYRLRDGGYILKLPRALPLD